MVNSLIIPIKKPSEKLFSRGFSVAAGTLKRAKSYLIRLTFLEKNWSSFIIPVHENKDDNYASGKLSQKIKNNA